MTDVWAAFVAARLDELAEADWHVLDCSGMPHADGQCCDVQRWLVRDVAAKREILAALAPPDEVTAEAWSNEEHVAHEVYGALVLKRLAFIWGNHPDHPCRVHQTPHSVV